MKASAVMRCLTVAVKCNVFPLATNLSSTSSGFANARSMKTLILSLVMFASIVSQAATQAWKPEIGAQYFLYGTMSQSYLVSIVEPRGNREWAFRWESGPWVGKYALNARPENLAALQGCTKTGLCIGDQVLVPSRNSATARVAGIAMTESSVVLCFESGYFTGTCGGSWNLEDLLRVR